MSRAFVAVGSNLGNRESWHAFAESALRGTDGILIERATALRSTAPLGGLDQPPYLNRMFLLVTTRGAPELLAVLHGIERDAGRERDVRWESRTLDLDLVRYDDLLCDTPTLVLPHPGLRDRIFWANEIAELESR